MERATCPCGTGQVRAACCGPFLEGTASAPTAEALMRSRFVAYRDGDKDYLLETWHTDTRPIELTVEANGLTWTRLEVVDVESGGPLDDAGVVEFKAHYRSRRKSGVLHERSRFRKVDACWLYIDGDLSPGGESAKKVGRNEPCPCGSRKKYKRCCGRGGR